MCDCSGVNETKMLFIYERESMKETEKSAKLMCQ